VILLGIFQRKILSKNKIHAEMSNSINLCICSYMQLNNNYYFSSNLRSLWSNFQLFSLNSNRQCLQSFSQQPSKTLPTMYSFWTPSGNGQTNLLEMCHSIAHWKQQGPLASEVKSFMEKQGVMALIFNVNQSLLCLSVHSLQRERETQTVAIRLTMPHDILTFGLRAFLIFALLAFILHSQPHFVNWCTTEGDQNLL